MTLWLGTTGSKDSWAVEDVVVSPTPYLDPHPYRGTSLIRRCTPLGPYSWTMSRVLGGF